MELIERTTAVMEALSSSRSGMSISDVAAAVALPPSTVHRILNSLRKTHLVVQDQQTKLYRLGYKLFGMCSNMQRNDCLIATARPGMTALSDRIKKTVVLCVMENDHIINIASVEKEDSDLFMVKIGRKIPMFATSAGRVHCAYMKMEEVKSLYDRMGDEAFTPFTKTSWDSLVRELVKIRNSGYACIDEELQVGMQGYASPIFNGNGNVCGALAFTMIKRDQESIEELVADLIDCANKITVEIS